MTGYPPHAPPSSHQLKTLIAESSHDAKSRGSGRYASIDVLRGAAILLMVVVHFVENLSHREPSSGWLYDAVSWLGVVPAPIFLFVSGLSFCLWARKQHSQGSSDDTITRIAVRRGLFLFAAGIAFNFFVWLPEDIFNWDVLTVIGASLMILAFARQLPPMSLGLICVMVLLLSPPLRFVADYPAYWEDGLYSYDFTLRDVLFGFLVNGYFPLLPWVIFPLTGFLTGKTLVRHQHRGESCIKSLLTIAVILMLVSAAGIAVGSHAPFLVAKYYTHGFSMYPASTEYVLGAVGLCLLGFALCHRQLDQTVGAVRAGPILIYLRRFSTFSLSVYIIHHLVHLWPLWFLAAIQGQDNPTIYWRNAVSSPTALALAMVFIVVCYVGLIILEQHKRYSFESLMRWLCD